jgi:hypothetical protein
MSVLLLTTSPDDLEVMRALDAIAEALGITIFDNCWSGWGEWFAAAAEGEWR